MARKQRDYKAEYARRQKLAQERGFKNYWQQRRKIEKAEVPALAPHRLRNRKTIERQTAVFPTAGRRKLEWYEKPNFLRDARIETAQAWSDWYAHADVMRFDAARAIREPHYLDVYMQAFVLSPHSDENAHTFDGNKEQREYFVELMEYFDVEEYEDRYGDAL